MTVNYTTLLALGQPVTGTESGTWGDDVNNAVTSYLDIAIAGTLSLTSANFTAGALTIANTQGTSSATNIGNTTAQYAVLKVSSLAQNSTITAPSTSKIYLVINADPTYTVTIKASGQTGYTVAVNSRAFVVFNGTDYVLAATNDISKLTGTVPVSQGGTGLTSGTSGGIPYFSGTTTMASSAALAANAIVLGGGAGAAPATTTTGTGVVAAIGNSTNAANGLPVLNASGYLAIAQGGTNSNATPTAGGVGYGTGTAHAYSAAGTSNQVLISNGASAPSWANLSSLGVTSFSAGTTGFTPNTVTTGAVTLAGTLATTNGGTGLTAFTANGILYASSTSALATGSALTFDGTNFATTGTVSGTNHIATGGSASGNSMYLAATNALGWSTNGTERMRITANGNLLLGTTTDFTTTTNAGNMAVAGVGIYPYTTTANATNTTAYSTLNVENATTFSGNNGTSNQLFYGVIASPKISNNASGGTTNYVGGAGGLFAPVVQTAAATARVLVQALAGQAIRGSSSDVSTNTNSSLAAVVGLVQHTTAAGAGIVSTTGTAGQFTLTNNNGTITTGYGVLSTANIASGTTSLSSSSTDVYQYFGQGTVGNTTGGPGTVTNYFGLRSTLTVGATGTITNQYGLYLDTPANTGTITNRWGVYQTDAAANNYFNGNVGIGLTPSTKLDVLGTIQTRPAATQDAVAIAGRAGGTLSYVATLTPTTLTASRTLTIPDNTGTILTTGATVTVGQGGTGQTTYTDGQLLIGNSVGNTLTKATLTAGSGISITNGNGSITIAASGASGTVTSVGLSAPAMFTVTNSPVTSSGTLTLTYSGTALPAANGGTGQTTYTDGQLLIGNSVGNTLSKATLTAGSGVSISNGNGSITISATGSGGTVTSVGWTGGIVSIANSTTTPAFTIAGTSGGIPYFSSASTWASSGALTANALMIGGGAGVAPSTTATGTGVLTALGTAVGSAGAFVTNGGVLGTPQSGTLTNCTGLPISTGVSGLGANVATFLATPSSANLSAAMTDETGSGLLVFGTSPSLTTPALAGETFSTSATVTAGTNSQGQGALTSDYNVVTTAASNPSGVTLPTATTGRRVIVVNKGANPVSVYPATGGTIDALALNAAITLPVNGVMEFNASSTTQWYSTVNSITSTGALTGTVAVANGGTGQTTYTDGQLLIGNTTGNTLTKATLTAGTGISITNGAGSITIAGSASATGANGQVFTGNGTFTIPTGVTALKVTVVGGGGAGEAAVLASSANWNGAGGGGGGTAIKYLTGLTPGNTLSVTVGAAAGNSTVASGTQTISTITGGGGGNAGTAAPYSGAGGTATGGDANIAGGDGGGRTINANYSFGGSGGTSLLSTAARGGVSSGTPDNSAYKNGTAGKSYGGGGGGGGYASGGNGTGGAGASGVVIIEW